MKKNRKKDGFTLIELLIVIAIIAIIAAVAFVALDPLTRFQDARDSSRWSDVSAVISAIKVDQVDNRGSYVSAISALDTGTVYMIGTGSTACNATCDTVATSTSACVDLAGLVTEGYLAGLPISPDGAGTWDAAYTGYTLEKSTTGALTVRACESENSDEILLQR